MYVYKLKHVRAVDEECVATKMIGYFSSKEKAEEVIESLIQQEGFCDYPDDFVIIKCEITGKIKDNKIYHLTHSYALDDEVDVINDFGEFSSMLAAVRERKEWLKQDEDMKKHPNGFCFDCYEIDTDINWEEGFFTYE